MQFENDYDKKIYIGTRYMMSTPMQAKLIASFESARQLRFWALTYDQISKLAKFPLSARCHFRMLRAMSAGNSTNQRPAAASAAVPAQAIDETASAKVPMREECRRRNWLRRACCVRSQS